MQINIEMENSLVRRLCNEYCRPRLGRDEEYFTREEILKMRQKRPAIQIKYQLSKIKVSKYKKALRNLGQINSLIDLL